MKLRLKNIGMIEEANIKLDGLTVIAGENNTGKSTVGRLLFSIIKASSRYKEDLEESKEDKIFALIEKNYFQLRRKINFSSHINIRELFYPPMFKKDIDTHGINAFDTRLEKIKSLKEGFLFETSENTENNIFLSELEKSILDIKRMFLQKEDKHKAQARAFKKVLMSEFKGKISNQNDIKNPSEIIATEGENKILEILMQKDSILLFDIVDELYFSDATFIETPAILQLSEAIDLSKTYFEEIDKEDRIARVRRANIPLHVKDLNDKLKVSFYDDELFDMEDVSSNIKDLLNKLTKIISGRIKYIKRDKDFKYITSNGQSYGSINTATGIKAFGIIQMLLKSGLIDERSLLILDEPEVHLHPKWQIKYAELIIELVKSNITVLVTSHSPYMIEALQKYSERANLTEQTNIYLSENNTIEDKNKLQEIYEKLSEPFDEFEKMDSDILNGK